MNNDAGVIETKTSYSPLSDPELAVNGSQAFLKLSQNGQLDCLEKSLSRPNI
jgi:hypothetical protein